MSDRNGDGLPLLAAVKADAVRILETHRKAAELALSRRRKARPPDRAHGLPDDHVDEPEPADRAPDHPANHVDGVEDEEPEAPPDQPVEETETKEEI